MTLFVFPQNTLCKALHLAGDSDHCRIFRFVFNTVIWGAVGMIVAVHFTVRV